MLSLGFLSGKQACSSLRWLRAVHERHFTHSFLLRKAWPAAFRKGAQRMHAGCAGAIGTAEFAGARLCDVLAYAGLSYEDGSGEACALQPHFKAVPVCQKR